MIAGIVVAGLRRDGSDAATGATRRWQTVAGYSAPASDAAGWSPAGGYGEAQHRPTVLAAVILLHVLALAALFTHRTLLPQQHVPGALLVVNVPLPRTPPPPAATPDLRLDAPAIVAPPPMIEILRESPPPAPVTTAEAPPPAKAPPAAPPAAEAAPAALASLPATMLEAPPPRYPLEARQRKEQGTVVLEVLLSPAGKVERIAIHQSSGSPRLDRAALDAVRRWRWSPMLRDGVAVAIRGLVEIPFVLQKR